MSNNLMPAWVTGIGKAAAGAADALPASIELIDGEQLQHCAVSLSNGRAMIMAGLLNKLCPAYGITTKDVLHEFLANVLQESLEFQHKVENMNYRAVTIVNTWPKRFYLMVPAAGKLDANKYARKPKELAIAVYGGRMGNNQPGDGWRFRGGGYIGLTGREVYGKYAAYIGKEIGEAADLVRSQDYYALDSAFWFFYILKGLKDESIRDEFLGIVKSINGGTIGLKDRKFYYDRIKAVVK